MIAAGSAAADTDQLARDFFSPPALDLLRLAPNGELLAGIAYRGHGYQLFTQRPDGRRYRVIHQISDTPVRLIWGNDDRLLVETARGDEHQWLAVDRTTGQALILEPYASGRSLQPIHLLSLEPAHVLFENSSANNASSRVERINIFDGSRDVVEPDNERVFRWIADGSGQIRVALAWEPAADSEPPHYRLLYRAQARSEFESLYEWTLGRPGIVPLRFIGQKLLVSESVTGDAARLSFLDPRAPDALEVVHAEPGFDVRSAHVEGQQARLVRVDAERPQLRALDADWAGWMRPLTTRFPDADVRLIDRVPGKLALVLIIGDQNPGVYWLVDLTTNRATEYGERYPWLNAERLAAMEAFPIRADDGKEMLAYRVVPNGSVKGIVIMPHGGPWARDSWGYDPVVQYLAAHGWAVGMVNYRGSRGLGLRHLNAGRGEWDRNIINDINALRDGLKKGELANVRTCIIGFSFGGYAALMSAAMDHSGYDCAGSIGGLVDVSGHVTTLGESGNRRGAAEWRYMSGAGTRHVTSPIDLLDRYSEPVFVAWGRLDQRLGPEQSAGFSKALRRHDLAAAGGPIDGLGHVLRPGDGQIELMTQLAVFLSGASSARGDAIGYDVGLGE